MKKNFLPLSVYNAFIAASLVQVGVNAYQLAMTLPSYRWIHGLAILVHLGMAGLFSAQRRKAKSYVPPIETTNEKPISLRSATGIFLTCLLLATTFEAFVCFFTIDFLRTNARHGIPISLGSVLSQVGMHAMFFGINYSIFAVGLRTVREARLAENAAAVKAEQTSASKQNTRTTWWTQDETRQEIKRR